MKAFYLPLIIAVSILNVSCKSEVAATSQCDRNCLQDIADNYLAALSANDASQVNFSEDVAFVENTQKLTPGQGLWETVVNVSDSYKIIVPDPELGSIGVLTVLEREHDKGEEGEEGTAPALLALRLKVEDGLITEAEHLVDEVPPVVDPATLSNPRPAMVSFVPADSRMTRDALFSIADSYYEGLVQSDASLVPFGEDCERQENGMITAAYYLEPATFEQMDIHKNPPPPVARDCIGQMDSGRFAYIDSIDHRRLAAIDPEKGLVMVFSHFRQSMEHGPHPMIAGDGTVVMWDEKRTPYDLPAVHVFKITDGAIHEVEAIGIFLPYDALTGWE